MIASELDAVDLGMLSIVCYTPEHLGKQCTKQYMKTESGEECGCEKVVLNPTHERVNGEFVDVTSNPRRFRFPADADKKKLHFFT